MKGEPGARPRALAGLAASPAGVPGAGVPVVEVASGGTVSVVSAETLREGWEPELLCVMGPPGESAPGGPDFLQYSAIEIDTVKPSWSMPWDVATGMTSYMGTGVISEKYYEEYGEEQAGFSLAVGTGPWQSVEHVTGGTWRFEAVQDHWRKTPNFAELHYAEISEESTRLANFLANKLDIATFNLESISQLEQQCADCKFKTFTTGAQLFINIHGNLYIDRDDLPTPRDPSLPWVSASADMNSPDWTNARKVRKAMAIAIDRQLLVDTLLQGKGAPAHVYGWAGFDDELGYLADLKHEYDAELPGRGSAAAHSGLGFHGGRGTGLPGRRLVDIHQARCRHTADGHVSESLRRLAAGHAGPQAASARDELVAFRISPFLFDGGRDLLKGCLVRRRRGRDHRFG